MAEDGPVTPEKQLLKLIEESKGGAASAAGTFAPLAWVVRGLAAVKAALGKLFGG